MPTQQNTKHSQTQQQSSETHPRWTYAWSLFYLLCRPNIIHHHVHSSPLWSQSTPLGISTKLLKASCDWKLISDPILPVGTAAWLVAALYRSRWPDGMEQICFKMLLRVGKSSRNINNMRGQSITRSSLWSCHIIKSKKHVMNSLLSP